MIRNVNMNDAEAICDIYNDYIQNTIVTFEEDWVSIEEMQKRFREVTVSFPWLVFESNGHVVGYAYASQWKGRHAYRHTVESTIYLSPTVIGRGIGSQLYEQLIADLRSRNIHSVIGGIALPNPASIALHKKMGFEKVAHFKEVGRKFNRWIDVDYWELIIHSPTP